MSTMQIYTQMVASALQKLSRPYIKDWCIVGIPLLQNPCRVLLTLTFRAVAGRSKPVQPSSKPIQASSPVVVAWAVGDIEPNPVQRQWTTSHKPSVSVLGRRFPLGTYSVENVVGSVEGDCSLKVTPGYVSTSRVRSDVRVASDTGPTPRGTPLPGTLNSNTETTV